MMFYFGVSLDMYTHIVFRYGNTTYYVLCIMSRVFGYYSNYQ